ncbi:MAG: N-acyl homoserine lactonase family protein [Bacteroidota bacterium]
MTRRQAIRLGAVAAAGASVGGCAVTSAVSSPDSPGPSWPPFAVRLGDVRVTAIRTGSVAVKRAHREWGGPAALGLPTIALSPRWTEWLPITCWLVEHPDGPILVDTGETPRVAEADYFACDGATQFVYERLLAFDVPRDQSLDAQLRALGVPPEEIRTLALTHLHSDHAGGLADVPNATAYLSRTDAERTPPGSVPCRWPDAFRPTPVDYADGPVGAFAESHALTADGAVRLVPTPGHTRGHQSVVVEGGGQSVMLAGDASFSLDQVRRRAVAGICEDPAAARRTLAVIAEHLEGTGALYLPSHALPEAG